MENFDFWAKEWPVIAQAPHLVIPGVVALFGLAWWIAGLWYKQQIETLRERLTLAQEKTAAAQEKAVALTEQIQANASKADLLKSANSTAAAIDQLVYITGVNWQKGKKTPSLSGLGFLDLDVLKERGEDGEINRKYGNTLIGTLRKTYGRGFASGFSDRDRLSDVLHILDVPSLSKLVQDHGAGRLHEIVARKS